MIAAIARRIGTTAITAPAGWVEIEQKAAVNDSFRMAIFYKYAGASEGSSYDFTVSADNVQGSGCIATFRGVNQSNPLDVTYVRANHLNEYSTDTTPAFPTITTNTNNAWVLALMISYHTTNLNYTANSGYTEAIQTNQFDNSYWRGAIISYKDVATAGLEDPGDIGSTVTGATSTGAFTLALNPTVASPSTLTSGTVTESSDGPTEVDLSVSTDGNDGTLYYYFSSNSTEDAGTVKSSATGSQAVTVTGTQTITGAIGWPPGSAHYCHFVHEDADLDLSNVLSVSATTTAYTASATYSGGVIPTDSLLMLYGGTVDDDHDGPDNN